mmetsp:Transcript_12376/g.33608  ORF Transcript_12376/g.33608 Transcript_12376/m.33608 type:complete len:268 (+) Transcript_12376:159-962(+)
MGYSGSFPISPMWIPPKRYSSVGTYHYPPIPTAARSFEPGHSVLPDTLEHVASVHGHVVVHQHDVAFVHLDPLEVLHHGLIDVLLPLVRDAPKVAEANVGAVEARRPRGLGELEGAIALLALLAQVVTMRMHVAEPHRLACIWVPHHWRLRRGDHMDARLALVILGGTKGCTHNSGLVSEDMAARTEAVVVAELLVGTVAVAAATAVVVRAMVVVAASISPSSTAGQCQSRPSSWRPVTPSPTWASRACHAPLGEPPQGNRAAVPPR